MAINKAMKLALKALSYPDIDIKKTYKLERSIDNLRGVTLPNSDYSIWDHAVVRDDHEVAVRIYEPSEITKNILLLFFHGGGWVKESIDSYNRVCKSLAISTGCRVASVEYGLAPENPFPHGLKDCYAVAKEVMNNLDILEISENQLVLIGDSAGGNLSSAVSLMARDKGEFKIHNQILIYPATYNDHTENSKFKSVTENGTDYLLTSKRICDYMDLYMQDSDEWTNPYFAPLLADDFTNLPKTLIITAEFDPLRDEGEEYGRRIKQAGGEAKIIRMKDALHGFISLPPTFHHVKGAYEIINNFLEEVIAECGKNIIQDEA